jgi:hypothetical protein
MKMARPKARDIEAADDLHWVLSAIDARWGGPWPTDGPDDLRAALGADENGCCSEEFDCDNREHLQALYNHLAKLLRRTPNFYGRVIDGMCHVICWDRNAILDPTDDCLSLHPDLVAGLELLHKHRADFLPQLEREARAAVAAQVEHSAATHLTAMRADWAQKASPA